MSPNSWTIRSYLGFRLTRGARLDSGATPTAATSTPCAPAAAAAARRADLSCAAIVLEVGGRVGLDLDHVLQQLALELVLASDVSPGLAVAAAADAASSWERSTPAEMLTISPVPGSTSSSSSSTPTLRTRPSCRVLPRGRYALTIVTP